MADEFKLTEKSRIMDSARMKRALSRLASEIVEENQGAKGLYIVGIRRRGVPLAERIVEKIEAIEGERPQYGIIDITLYRDDLSTVGANPIVNRTELDDYSACKITRKEDWVDLYVKPYYFGCEADDRLNATAFSRGNPFGAQLNAIYSSDIGHFDVIDYRDPLPEAYELVEEKHITADNFRDFVFANAVRLWGKLNPDFFKGTIVEKEAASVLATQAGTQELARVA